MGVAPDRRQLSDAQASQVAGLARTDPRFHFTPTSASWLNAVEGFFAKLSRQRLSSASSRVSSIPRPPSIATNDKPKPFTWTADPDAIIERVRRVVRTRRSAMVSPVVKGCQRGWLWYKNLDEKLIIALK